MGTSNEQDHFLLEEYRRLCKEVEAVIREIRQSERFALIAMGTIWGYLLGLKSIYSFAFFLPLLLCILLCIKNYFQGIHLKSLGDYLSTIEGHFLADDVKGYGWERYIRGERRTKRIFIRDYHNIIFWGAVFLASGVLPFVVMFSKVSPGDAVGPHAEDARRAYVEPMGEKPSGGLVKSPKISSGQAHEMYG